MQKEFMLPSENNDVTNIEVRGFDNLLDNEIELLKSAGLLHMAPHEAWTALGTNNQLSYATHGAFRYFGKFPPPIATHLIKKYTDIGDLICDPMCGSGTTGVEALLLNRESILNDINPLSTLLADVKTKSLDEEQMRAAVARIEKNYRPLTEEEYDFNPVGLRNADHWFLPSTKDSLRGIRKLITNEEDENIRKFLFAAFASTVRRVSKATTQQGRLFLDVEKAEENALPQFLKRAEVIIKGVLQLPENRIPPKILSFNLKEEIPGYLKNKADLLILHPPYFNLYKYSSINSLELSWLGFDYNPLRKSEVKEFFKVGKPEKVSIYVDEMAQVVSNVIPILKPGATFAIMIGDTIMKGKHIPVTKMLLEKLDFTAVELELIAIRVPKYTEASWAASQRRKRNDIGITLYDYILVLRRL